jgi:hypothetical protein
MIKVGFIEKDEKCTALEIFNEICITEKLGIASLKISDKDFHNHNTEKLNILVFDNCEYLKDNDINQFLKDSIGKNSILVLNIDDKKNIKFLKGLNSVFITYGLDSKSSVTASSIQEIESFDEIQYCIQRTIPTLLGDKIEQQEFRTLIYQYKHADTCKMLAAISVALICGLEIKKFEKIIL